MSSTPLIHHAVDMLWCDTHGVYVQGWILADDAPVSELELCSGDARIEIVDRSPRPDLIQHFPTLTSDQCGFSGYLECSPFRAVTLRALANEGWIDIDINGPTFPAAMPSNPDKDWMGWFIDEMRAREGIVAEIGARQVSPGASLQASRFAPECTFIGIDAHAAHGVDIVADAHFLSDALAPGSIDGVFSLAVLEHVAAPWLAAAEINRVLKMGGLTYHVVPQSWPVHEMPNDFWRMTDEALRILFGPATGFEVVHASMQSPVQMIPEPSLRTGAFLQFPLCPGMAGSFVVARKVAELDPDAVRWPIDRMASLERARLYPNRNAPAEPDAEAEQAASEDDVDRDAKVLRASDLFDPKWYLAQNVDVAAANVDPAKHYLLHGGFENRDPGPGFSSRFYLSTNIDVLRAGMNPLLHYVQHGSREGRLPKNPYGDWLAAYDDLDEYDWRAIARHIDCMAQHPRFSIVLPVFDPDPEHLAKAIESVIGQTYPHWELCIADDCSTSTGIVAQLTESAARDDRIKLMVRDVNGNISAASNSALALATGDFVCLLDHDDELHPNALYELAVKLNERPDADIIFTDCDQIDEHGYRFNPYFKSGWNYDLLLGHNLVGHFDAYRRTLIDVVGGFRLGYEGSQDYDLTLRAIDATVPSRIHHIPTICYHWRRDSRATSFSARSHDKCMAAARHAISDHLARREIAAQVEPNPRIPNFNRVVWALPSPGPSVTVAIIHGEGIDGLIEAAASVASLDLIVTAPATLADEIAETMASAGYDRVRVLPMTDDIAPAERKNRAVEASTGDVVILLDAGTTFGGAETLRELVSQASRSDIGIAAPLLLDETGIVHEAGIVLNSSNDSPRVPRDYTGQSGLLALVREVSAAGTSCMAIRRELYLRTGGLRPDLGPRQSAVDLSSRLRELGYRTIITPFAECIKAQSDFTDLSPAIVDRDHDPLYSPHLSLDGLFARLVIPSRRTPSWAEYRRELAIRDGQTARASTLLDGVPKTARLLEVGASYSPIAPRSEGWNTTIIDHADRADLIAKYSGQSDIWTDRIEEVDHVWQSGSLRDALPAEKLGMFDAMISSHSIEHMPDVISFLLSAADILREDGTLILAIPDKRYCFDYFRHTSTTPQLLEAYQTNRSRHPRRVGAEHWGYTATNGGAGAWGQQAIEELAFATDFDQAMRWASELNDQDEAPYQDFHAWVFTPASFELIVLELARIGIIDWKIERRTSEIGCEFHARLRRGGSVEARAQTPSQFQARRLGLLREGLMETVTQARYLGLVDDRTPISADTAASFVPVN